MSKFLILDIGAGTMDILYYDSETGIHYKAVGKSPVLNKAEQIENISGKLLITGNEMGGGAVSNVIKNRVGEHETIMSKSSAATIHHDLERVRSFDIKVVDDHEAEEMKRDKSYFQFRLADAEIGRLQDIVTGLGIPFSFDILGICAQDHGIPPDEMSHLDYRHAIFKEKLDQNPFAHMMLYRADEIPKTMNRLTSIANDAKRLSIDEIYVMDSGMAAILGASMDPMAVGKSRLLLLDIATSHTIGAAIHNGEIAGFFEYHTKDITLKKLESLLIELANGKVDHKRILKEGGHGAYIRSAFGFNNVEAIIATGPKRFIIHHSSLPITLGTPMGDNMMTGTVGVLEAIRRRKGFKSFSYM